MLPGEVVHQLGGRSGLDGRGPPNHEVTLARTLVDFGVLQRQYDARIAAEVLGLLTRGIGAQQAIAIPSFVVGRPTPPTAARRTERDRNDFRSWVVESNICTGSLLNSSDPNMLWSWKLSRRELGSTIRAPGRRSSHGSPTMMPVARTLLESDGPTDSCVPLVRAARLGSPDVGCGCVDHVAARPR